MPHRCSQLFIEPVIRRHAEKYPSVHVRFGMKVTGFKDLGTHVRVEAEPSAGGPVEVFESAYFVACDGSRSPTRAALGIEMAGLNKVEREFMGGRMYAAYFASSDLYQQLKVDPAWLYWTINHDRRSVMAALDGKDTFVFHTQLRGDENNETIDAARAQALFEQALGGRCDFRLLHGSTWNAGYMLVADRYQEGRVLLAGDAVHLFTPTGGLGYNTAVDDVANLGWKLAGALQGWGGPGLVPSYAAERRPIGLRNTGMSRQFADSIGGFKPSEALEQPGPAGDAARAEAGRYLLDHAQREFNIPGITFGVRYDGSPIIVSDGTAPPPDVINDYVPNAVPGGRTPHLWLANGESLYDRFGSGFTLLRLDKRAETTEWERAASHLGCPLKVVDISGDGSAADALAVYEAPLALIRPDQHVAWRGAAGGEPLAVLAQACGHAAKA
jgi:2-polyprenyl-6-methoxyphenol hydroxylase-like FAD-dependent oxidoreductase